MSEQFSSAEHDVTCERQLSRAGFAANLNRPRRASGPNPAVGCAPRPQARLRKLRRNLPRERRNARRGVSQRNLLLLSPKPAALQGVYRSICGATAWLLLSLGCNRVLVLFIFGGYSMVRVLLLHRVVLLLALPLRTPRRPHDVRADSGLQHCRARGRGGICRLLGRRLAVRPRARAGATLRSAAFGVLGGRGALSAIRPAWLAQLPDRARRLVLGSVGSVGRPAAPLLVG
mmetsp:Transcript_4267/g.9745  ORF Transcript_4267/g.9745 Transcript_4267/m.9745 type:complete len:231 (-) Transcript_4267:210-902(-)|eukprot:3168891-Prymnesium_polylepis.3